MSITASSSSSANRKYNIRLISKKGVVEGKGMFATETIDAGEVIAQETPIMVFEANIGPLERAILNHYEKLENHSHYDALFAVAKLPKITPWMNQVEQDFEHDEDTERIISIHSTNGMMDSGGEWSYVAANAVRINHSCVPNASFDYIRNGNISVVRALREIEKDEQVFVSYVHC